MSHVSPLALEDLDPASRQLLEQGRELMGFLPNDGLTMARLPPLLSAMSSLVQAVYGEGTVPLATKRLVAMMSSQAAGCQYCRAHTRFGAGRHGIDPDKLEEMWEFEESTLFSEAEKAALNVAWLGSLVPNQVATEDMRRLKTSFDETQVLEIIGVISLFGFLNRWNDTLKTEVEELPASVMEKNP